jgi:hypothetical protein
MENLEIILSIAGTAFGLLITTITFLSQFIKNLSKKKSAENLTKISNAVMPFVEEAENFIHFSGEEKKQYVLTKANQFAIDNGIKFDSVAVGEKIERLVELTKKVNARITSATTATGSMQKNI